MPEAPQYVRSDRLTLICGDQAADAVAVENVEMVKPEVNQHFVELLLALNGTNHTSSSKLLKRNTRLPLKTTASFFVEFLILPHEALSGLGRGVTTVQLANVHLKGRKPVELGIDRSVRDAFRLELPADVTFSTELIRQLPVASSRAKRNAVENMSDRPSVVGLPHHTPLTRFIHDRQVQLKALEVKVCEDL